MPTAKTAAPEATDTGRWPAWLPSGSVRSLLAGLTIIFGWCAFIFTDKLDLEGLLAVTGPVTALYFGQYMKEP